MEILLSEYNANPSKYARGIMDGEITLIEDPPEPEPRVHGANGESLSREEFDALKLSDQAAFVIGKK